MANIILNGKTVVTQTGNDEPVLGSNVILTNDSLASATFPAGHVLQVVQGTWTGVTSTFTSSDGWVDPSWYADIQVQSGNKVLIMIDGSYEVITSGTTALVSIASAANNTTVDENDFIINPLGVLSHPMVDGVSFSGSYLHTSPQSTVPQRYKVLFKSEANFNVRFGSQSGSGYTQNAITLFEIQA